MDEDEFFNNILSVVEETTNPKSTFKDDPNFLNAPSETTESLVHTGLTDSSDDEDNRDFQHAKYNSFGKAVKYGLDANTNSSSSLSSVSSVSSKWAQKPKYPVADNKQLQIPDTQKTVFDVYTDPVFGLRIYNPLVPSNVLKDRMQGRMAISLLKLRQFVENIPANADWVVAGVIVAKTGKTSQKGNPFSIWTLSDMHGDLKTFSLFLFRSAYKDLWKCSVGTVVGILNPAVFEKKQGSKDEACLSVDNVQKVMLIGQSKDYGTCRSVRKDGTPCTSFVNVNKCEYCIYHIKQEYQKCSKRSELQSTFSGRGLNSLRNKVLGKNEVFYAGKSFSAIPATRSRKLQAKDQGRMNLLSAKGAKDAGHLYLGQQSPAAINAAAKKRAAATQHVEVSASRRLKDLELLKKLGGGNTPKSLDIDTIGSNNSSTNGTMSTSSEVTLKDSKSTALSVIAKLKAKKVSETSSAVVSSGVVQENNVIDDDMNGLSDIDFGLSDDESDKLPKVVSKVNESKLTVKSPELKETKEKPTTIKQNITQTERNTSQILPPSIAQPKKLLVSQLGATIKVPILSGIGNKLIDLSSPITQKHVNRANLNALKWVQRNGPIQKENPNQTKTTPKGGKKRVLEVLEKHDPKRRKIQESDHFSQRFKQMMAATSKHTDLLEQRDNQEAEKYFNKLEMKEKMEEKMINTLKVECKAVKCLQCKYTSFSAADRCKVERHPLKVFDAVKRFFKCGECGNRTISLNVIPTQSCKKCGGGKWERAGMMQDKIVVPKPDLSIRGGEQEHINSNVTNANINLLVPDS